MYLCTQNRIYQILSCFDFELSNFTLDFGTLELWNFGTLELSTARNFVCVCVHYILDISVHLNNTDEKAKISFQCFFMLHCSPFTDAVVSCEWIVEPVWL